MVRWIRAALRCDRGRRLLAGAQHFPSRIVCFVNEKCVLTAQLLAHEFGVGHSCNHTRFSKKLLTAVVMHTGTASEEVHTARTKHECTSYL